MDVKNNYFYNNTQKLLTGLKRKRDILTFYNKAKFNKYTPWELVAVAPIV